MMLQVMERGGRNGCPSVACSTFISLSPAQMATVICLHKLQPTIFCHWSSKFSPPSCWAPMCCLVVSHLLLGGGKWGFPKVKGKSFPSTSLTGFLHSCSQLPPAAPRYVGLASFPAHSQISSRSREGFFSTVAR